MDEPRMDVPGKRIHDMMASVTLLEELRMTVSVTHPKEDDLFTLLKGCVGQYLANDGLCTYVPDTLPC